MPSNAELAAILSGFLPGYEPRYAYIVLSRLLGSTQALVISIGEAVLLAVLLGLVAEEAWELLLRLSTRIKALRILVRRVVSAQEKARNLIERYGVIGLSLFVAVPLPVTGIYTGSVVAVLLGLNKRAAILSLVLGGVSSVLIVAVLSELGGRIIG